MDDLNGLLGSLMSDPKSFEMLKGLAEQLSKGAAAPAAAAPAPEPAPAYSPPAQEPRKQQSTPQGFPDLSGLGDIASLIGGADPSLLAKAASLMGSYNSVDTGKLNLLNSLKPYMSPEKSGRVDGAIRMLKIFQVAGALGISPDIFGRRR